MLQDGARDYLKRLNALSAERGDDVRLSADDIYLGQEYVRKIIAERIVDVLISLGGRHQAGLIKDSVIATERFPEQTEEEILELLPIDGHLGHEFCQQLLAEVKAYLIDGGVIAGRWGRVEVRNTGELELVVLKPLRARHASARSRLETKTIDL